MTAMNLDAALRDLAEALAERPRQRSGSTRFRAARTIVAARCIEALGLESAIQPSVPTVIRQAAEARARPAQRACAVLLLHALAVPGLIPADCSVDICSLMEAALRSALVRCGYPFSGSVEERMRVLRRLHASIGELLQPLEPTFPNWQGLYAG
jgi:hypothetical protein